MTRRLACLLLLVPFSSSACGKERAAPSPTPSEWTDFEGIQYRAPPGTQQVVRDSVLPGPGGLGGRPSGVLVEASISKANPNGFYVELERSRDPSTLEGTKGSLVSNGVGRNLMGQSTATGWELTYEQIGGSGASVGLVHVLYTDLGGKHYRCTWAEANCADKKAADALCRSLRPKP
ncbi:MAG: hypothetical protein JST00_04970 [Deltaproteobacteria bacterium]|nr:hypothetical protein [Deltaproteobacteria bacterium]